MRITFRFEPLIKFVFNSNTTSGYEIAGNFRSQIRVFVSATIFTSERSEQVKIVLRNKYECLRRKFPAISYPRVCIRHDNSPNED
jgi:hypothetical protein